MAGERKLALDSPRTTDQYRHNSQRPMAARKDCRQDRRARIGRREPLGRPRTAADPHLVDEKSTRFSRLVAFSPEAAAARSKPPLASTCQPTHARILQIFRPQIGTRRRSTPGRRAAIDHNSGRFPLPIELHPAHHLTLDRSINIHRLRLASMAPTRLARLDVPGQQFPQPRNRPDRRIIDQLRSRTKILRMAPAVKLGKQVHR